MAEPSDQFALHYDTYLKHVYPNDHFVGELIEFIRSHVLWRTTTGVPSILDCAAGTGFPALSLIQELGSKVTVHCTDGHPDMVEQLRLNAKDRSIDPTSLQPPRTAGWDGDPLVCAWEDLDSVEGRYDYVMCRGNSLVYAGTWDGGDRPKSSAEIRQALARIGDKVAPGGYLHIDGPRDADPHAKVEGDPPEIRESIEVRDGARRWTVGIPVEGGEVSYARSSALLSISDLENLLGPAFKVRYRIPFPRERPAFAVIVAKKQM